MSNQIEADFGFTLARTRKECEKPVFADRKLHRVAILKDFHVGSPGDANETGIPGWVSKFVCTGCGKPVKVGGFSGFFHLDSTHQNANNHD